MLFVQCFVAFVKFLLVLVFGLCTVVGGALRGKFTLQGHAVHLGNELAFGYYGIVVYMNLVNDTAHLGTHFHFCHRFNGSRGGYGFGNLAFMDGCCGVGHLVLGLGTTEEPYAAAHYDYGSYGNEDDSFFVHIYKVL